MTDYDYDSNGKLKKITFAKGTVDEAVQEFEYDDAGNQTAMIDENDNRTEYKYDKLNRLEKIIFAKGTQDEAVQKFEYDEDGNQTATIDENDNRTEYKYDDMNRMVKEISPDPDGVEGPLSSPVMTYEYDEAGNQVLMVDPLGRRTEYRYDSRNRLIETIHPDGSRERMRYDFDNNRTSSFDGNGNRTNMVYDARGRMIRTIDPDLKVTRFQYNPANQLIAQTDANNHRTEYKYDDLSRQTDVIEAPGTDITSTSTTEYDEVGNVTASIDGNNHRTKYLYDKRDRQTHVIDALDQPGVTITKYDDVGNVVEVTDPVDNTTTFVYDARNRLKEETNQLGKTRSFVYDKVGNRTAMTDRNSRKREFTYDGLNRQTKEKWLDATANAIRTINSTYDAASQLIAVTDPDSTYKFTYDLLGRHTKVDNFGTPNVPNVVLNYDYDNQGNLLSVSDTINGQAKGVTAYSYDPLNHVTQITQSGNGVANKRVDFGFDNIGQYNSINRYADLNGTQLVTGSTYSYNAKNRLDILTHSNATSPVAFYDFDYDPADRITRITDIDGVTDYDYDKTNQLTDADHTDNDNPDESYTYDENGNRITSSRHGSNYETVANNRLESDGTYNYTYDDEGNLIRRTEIATNKVTEYTWDYRNRLVGVTDKNAAGNAVQKVALTYDAMNRRLSKAVDSNPQDTVDGAVTHFVYDRDNVLLDFVDRDGAAGVNAPVLDKRYLHGTGVDQVLAQEDASGDVTWHLTDHLGTVRDLVNNSGTVVNHFTYDSFGNVVSQTLPVVNTRYLFTGREFDKETSLYYYRTRYYDGSVGRFISLDPIGFAGGDFNLYRYVQNNPIDSVDPFGQDRVGKVTSQVRSVNLTQNDKRGQRVSGDFVYTFGSSPKQGGIYKIKTENKPEISFDLTVASIIYAPIREKKADPPAQIQGGHIKNLDDRGHIVANELGGDNTNRNNFFAQNGTQNWVFAQLFENPITEQLSPCDPLLNYSVSLFYEKKLQAPGYPLRPSSLLAFATFPTTGRFFSFWLPNPWRGLDRPNFGDFDINDFFRR